MSRCRAPRHQGDRRHRRRRLGTALRQRGWQHAAGANFMHVLLKGAGEVTMAVLSGTIDSVVACTLAPWATWKRR